MKERALTRDWEDAFDEAKRNGDEVWMIKRWAPFAITIIVGATIIGISLRG